MCAKLTPFSTDSNSKKDRENIYEKGKEGRKEGSREGKRKAEKDFSASVETCTILLPRKRESGF